MWKKPASPRRKVGDFRQHQKFEVPCGTLRTTWASFVSGELEGKDWINWGIGGIGASFNIVEAFLQREKSTLLSIGSKKAIFNLNKYINPSIAKLGKVTRGLGVAGVLLNGGIVTYDYFMNHKDITVSKGYDIGVAVILAAATFTNPWAITGFLIYGFIDSSGLLDGVKRSLGGDKVLFRAR